MRYKLVIRKFIGVLRGTTPVKKDGQPDLEMEELWKRRRWSSMHLQLISQIIVKLQQTVPKCSTLHLPPGHEFVRHFHLTRENSQRRTQLWASSRQHAYWMWVSRGFWAQCPWYLCCLRSPTWIIFYLFPFFLPMFQFRGPRFTCNVYFMPTLKEFLTQIILLRAVLESRRKLRFVEECKTD